MNDFEKCKEVVLMREEAEQLKEFLTRIYCLENDLDSNNASDYSKASIEVTEYIDMGTYDSIQHMENAFLNGTESMSEYGFSLKDTWRTVRNVRDIYKEKLTEKLETTKTWADEKIEAAEEFKAETQDKIALGSFFIKVRSANKGYLKCQIGKDAKIIEICGNVTGEGREKCERKTGEKWDDKCSNEAMATVRDALQDAINNAGTQETKNKLGLLNMYMAFKFEAFLERLKSMIREKFPKYTEHLKYL